MTYKGLRSFLCVLGTLRGWLSACKRVVLGLLFQLYTIHPEHEIAILLAQGYD